MLYIKKTIQDRAYKHLRNAIYHNIVVPLKNCDVCGSDKSVDAHHEDYTKPLEVDWLCRKCHIQLHRGIMFVGLMHKIKHFESDSQKENAKNTLFNEYRHQLSIESTVLGQHVF